MRNVLEECSVDREFWWVKLTNLQLITFLTLLGGTGKRRNVKCKVKKFNKGKCKSKLKK